MKTRSENRYLLPVAAAAVLVILAGIVIVTNRSREEKTLADEGNARPVAGSGGGGNSTARQTLSRDGLPDHPPGFVRRKRIVQVQPRAVLATVNGTPIRLEHLMPVRWEESKASPMERSIYRSRLQRAIEAELVFQEAEAVGIALSDTQQRRLDQITPNHDADLANLAPIGVTWDSVAEEQIDLERTLKAAMMLRQNLVTSRDGVAPSPDREKQALYEEALQVMLAELKAAGTIEEQDIP